MARLVLGDLETRADFMAGTTTFRWIFCREGTDVWIRLLDIPDGRTNDSAGTEIWSSQQNVHTLARVVVRCFDEVARKHGEAAIGTSGAGRSPASSSTPSGRPGARGSGPDH